MSKLIPIVLIFIGIFCNSYSQEFSIKIIKEKNPKDTTAEYEFPILIGKNEQITTKINSNLSFEFLEVKYQNQVKGLFKNVWGNDKNSLAKLSFLKVGETYLNHRIYSITLSGESCGASCSNFETHCNFDLKMGNRIKLESIISEKYKTIFLDSISKWKLAKVQFEIANCKSNINNSNIKAVEKEYYKSMIPEYEDCFTHYESYDYIDFSIISKDLTIYLESCSNRDENSYIFKLNLNEWRWILSDYAIELTNN